MSSKTAKKKKILRHGTYHSRTTNNKDTSTINNNNNNNNSKEINNTDNFNKIFKNNSNNINISGSGSGNNKKNKKNRRISVNVDGTDLPIAKNSLSTFYDMLNLLGQGVSSQVFLAKNKKTHENVAVKLIPRKILINNKDLAREIRILRQISHSYIVQLKDVFITIDYLQIIMEAIEGQELFDEICARKSFTEGDAKDIVSKLLDALGYLHSLQITHRDLKPENIMFIQNAEGTNHLKIIDFGFAATCEELLEGKGTAGTLGYKAPEILKQESCTTKSDMWSLGVITYILLVGFPPFFSYDEYKDVNMLMNAPFWTFFNDETDQLLESIREGKVYFPKQFWDNISPEAKDFVESLLKVNPEERSSALAALRHPWIQEFTSESNLPEFPITPNNSFCTPSTPMLTPPGSCKGSKTGCRSTNKLNSNILLSAYSHRNKEEKPSIMKQKIDFMTDDVEIEHYLTPNMKCSGSQVSSRFASPFIGTHSNPLTKSHDLQDSIGNVTEVELGVLNQPFVESTGIEDWDMILSGNSENTIDIDSSLLIFDEKENKKQEQRKSVKSVKSKRRKTALNHKWKKTSITTRWCDHCDEFIWGLKKQTAVKCQECGMIIHFTCKASLTKCCTAVTPTTVLKPLNKQTTPIQNEKLSTTNATNANTSSTMSNNTSSNNNSSNNTSSNNTSSNSRNDNSSNINNASTSSNNIDVNKSKADSKCDLIERKSTNGKEKEKKSRRKHKITEKKLKGKELHC